MKGFDISFSRTKVKYDICIDLHNTSLDYIKKGCHGHPFLFL